MMRSIAVLLALWLQVAACGAATLRLTTWDFGWLTLRPAGDPALPPGTRPHSAADLARLAAYLAALNADVVAFQGVDGPDAARSVFPAERWALHMTGDGVLQRTGFALRHGLDFTPQPDLTALDLYAHSRYRLRSGADIRLDLPAGPLRLLSVHLKGGCREAPLDSADIPACATLREQGAVLAAWVARRQQAHEAFAVLGDFARGMDGGDTFAPALAPSGTLLRATEGHASPCWGGAAFVDHILLGGDARGWMQPGSLRVMVYRETGADWHERLSGHCPVSVGLAPPS